VGLSGQKVLITGAAGNIGLPLTEYLAADNEVWALARFTDAEALARIERTGATPYRCDLAGCDFVGLPTDFAYVMHLAAVASGDDFDRAMTINAEGTGLLLQHCRRAKGVLVMSTHSVYKPHDDPWHVYLESDPLGVNAGAAPIYSVSKIGQEAVARYCARALDVPVVIARLNTCYGPNGGGLLTQHMDAVAAGKPIITRWNPCPYSIIHQDDIKRQAGALLDAARVPATVVNWAGDDAVTVQDWATYMGELAGYEPEIEVQEMVGALRGLVADVEKRKSITGPCSIGWREGVKQLWKARHGKEAPRLGAAATAPRSDADRPSTPNVTWGQWHCSD
jgi:nucleoside-diphosphate-sugar epimerase